MCYLCYAQRSSSAPLFFCQSKWGQNDRWQKEFLTKCQDQCSLFFHEWQSLRLLCCPTFWFLLCVSELNTKGRIINAHIENVHPISYSTEVIPSHTTSQQQQLCQIVSLSLYHFLFEQRSPQSKSFQNPFFIYNSHRNWLGVQQCPRANSCQVW